MSSSFVSRFTPSLMTPETLESLFVQRQKLSEQVMDDIRHSAETKSKHYNLLIGPRGFGKTHFVSVIYNRVMAQGDLKDKLLVAWLREEERGVASFLELLMRVLRALSREYSDESLDGRIQGIYDLSRKDGERAAADLLVDYIGSRSLLLIIENLDSIFAGLKDPGQKSLRAFLQEHPICTLLATSTVLFNGVSLQTSVFYGFFRIHHLEELTLDDAVGLLANIAQVKGDNELTLFIRTPTGRARIRAVHHMAGGNHRVYVVFSEFLTASSLDQLVDPFMRMLDDLTPYYQGRIDLLSPQQQQIVELLAHAGAPQTVKEIARRSFMTQQTAANQLKDLKEKGYLIGTTPQSDRRETYYELREPLMRLCFEVKEYRGGPIRLFVDFLRSWYSRDELLHRLQIALPTSDIEKACLYRALDLMKDESEDARVQACLRDLSIYEESGLHEQRARAAEELASIRGIKEDWCFYGACLFLLNRDEDALGAFRKALEIDVACVEAALGVAGALIHLGQHSEGLDLLASIADRVPDDCAAEFWYERATALLALGQDEEALVCIETLIDLRPESAPMQMFRAVILSEMDLHSDALEAYQTAMRFGGGDDALVGQAVELAALLRYEDATMLIDAHPQLLQYESKAINRVYGLLLYHFGRYSESLLIFDQLAADTPQDYCSAAYRVLLLSVVGRLQEAMSYSKERMMLLVEAMPDILARVPLLALSAVAEPSVAPAERDNWLRYWSNVAGDRDEFSVPLSLLRAVTTYLNTGDDRELLQLPAELRSVIAGSVGWSDGRNAQIDAM